MEPHLLPLDLFICKEAVIVSYCKVSHEFVSVKQNMTHAAICLTSIANMFPSAGHKNNVPLATAGKKKTTRVTLLPVRSEKYKLRVH